MGWTGTRIPRDVRRLGGAAASLRARSLHVRGSQSARTMPSGTGSVECSMVARQQPALDVSRRQSLTRARAGRPGSGPRRACGPSAAAGARPARRTGRRRGRGAPGRRPGDVVADRDRAEHLGPVGSLEQGQRVVDRPGLAGDRGQPGRRRQVRLAALGDLALGEAGVVPAHQRLERRGGPGRRPRPPGRRGAAARPRWSSGAAPPPRRAGRRGPRVSQVSSRTTAA